MLPTRVSPPCIKPRKATGHQLADPAFQLTELSYKAADAMDLPPFRGKLLGAGLFPVLPT